MAAAEASNPEGQSRKVIDLRSDTVTRPSPAMRKAMAEAVVGDDIYGEDPTIIELERRSAEYFGKEAALFVASGTMGNLLAIMSHCWQRGAEIIIGQQSHIHRSEQGNYAQIAGVSASAVANRPDGSLCPKAVESAIRDHRDMHKPKTEVICLENTHNYCGGRTLSVDYMREMRQLADRHGVRIHVDGARLLNAALARQVHARELVADADSVQVCFSKGMGAPVGSVLCGEAAFIERARRARKPLGGAWRQGGILAAAALIGLENGVQTVTRDHATARRLAQGLNALVSDKFHVDMDALETNIVMVQLNGVSAKDLSAKLAGVPSVLCNPADVGRLRLVTHCDVDETDIDAAVAAFAKLNLT